MRTLRVAAACAWAFALTVCAAGAAEGPTGIASRPSADVLAEIEKAGSTPPDWYESTPLEYPDTMDLKWTKPGKNWDADRNLGQYLWSVVDADEAMGKRGARLLHHTLTVNKDNPHGLGQSMRALGHVYANILGDYARGAFWLQAASKQAPLENYNRVLLAMCYWKLGGKTLAMETLTATQFVSAESIKLLSEMGELDLAIDRASFFARHRPVQGHLAAGEAYRLHGRYEDAAKHYRFILSANAAQGGDKQSKARASRALEIMDALKKLDLSRVPDGAYEAENKGYVGPVRVRVVMKGGRIESVAVLSHEESRALSAIGTMPRRIVEKQGFAGVDAVTGATITSDAIVNAAVKALVAAMKKPAAAD